MMNTLTYRAVPATAVSPVTANGRSYAPTASFADVAFGDAQVLAANGWELIGRVGTTAQRPSSAISDLHPAKRGDWYVDTTLGKMIRFDGVNWRDPVTGGVV